MRVPVLVCVNLHFREALPCLAQVQCATVSMCVLGGVCV